MDPRDLLTSFVGRTIIDVSVDEDELALGLDDGRIVWVYSEDDELFMSVSDEEMKPSQ